MISGIIHMGLMGLLVSVAPPALITLGRGWLRWDRFAVPALVAAPLMVVVHATMMVLMIRPATSALAELGEHVLLLSAAVLYWLPVLGSRHRLPDAGRAVYLYVTMPMLDIVSLYLILRGHAAGGLAMIVAMMPIGLAALLITVRWITLEEREIDRRAPAPAAAGRAER